MMQVIRGVKEVDDAWRIDADFNGLQVERKVATNLCGTFDALGGHYREDGKGISARLVTEADPFLHRPRSVANLVYGVPEFSKDTRVEFARFYKFFEFL
jgi:hypothetical protein